MTSPTEPSRLTVAVSDRDHCQGNPSARITLVQYGDYQCPGCQAAHDMLPVLQETFGEQIRFVFRHFPQAHLHPNAYHAAEAAEAAASQNKFWEMHHHLLQHQTQLADSDLVEYAIALYLDVNQFLAEMASDCHMARVQADIDSGRQSGVIKTPTFFITTCKYNNNQSLETLLDKISQENLLG
jgi:protein-disulfide isomerase